MSEAAEHGPGGMYADGPNTEGVEESLIVEPSEPATDEKEWSVDWEVKVLVSLTKTVTLTAMEIIDAGSADDAVQKVKDELEAGVDIRDLDITSQISDSDFEIDGVEMDTFKVTDEVTPWGT